MKGADASKVDANAKADASDASNSSKIGTPKIDVKREIGKPCDIAISLSLCMSLRQKALRYSQSAGEGADTEKFGAMIDLKKRGNKRGNKIQRETKIRRETKTQRDLNI